jgi:hypothetical protein
MADKRKVDSTLALQLWNAGQTLEQIGGHLGVSLWAARWAVKRAVSEGLGTARKGRVKAERPEPPMAALWNFPN